MSASRDRLGRRRGLVLAGVAVAGLISAGVALPRSPGPPPPHPDGPHAAALPAGPGASTVQRIEALQAAVREDPRDAADLASLGLQYYQRVRETGDVGFYVRAEQSLRRAARIDPRSVDAHVGLATVALARHDFARGLAYARRARALEPRGVKAYPGIVDGLIELGRYRAAERVIQRFVDLRPTLPSYARVSYFRELTGDLRGAVQAMRFAVSAGGDVPENVAYVQTLVGDLEFLRGRRAAARRAYERALDGVAGYLPARFGLAQAAGAEGRLRRSIAGLRAVVNRLPLPQYVTALGEAELAAGRPAAARRDFAIIRAQQRLLRASGVNTDAEVALYEAGHGDARRGVALGRQAWRDAPGFRSADALGWALTRAGRPAAGLRWARRAVRLGTRDPLLLYRAGETARRAGRPAEARRYLRRALARNPRFSAYYAPRARRALRAVR